MRPVLTPQEAADLDRAAEGRGIPTATLMENAGRALARTVLDVMAGAYGRRVVVVCGKGNNGGDGFVAARHLDAAGARVVAIPVQGLPDREPSASAFAGLAETNVRVAPPERLPFELERADAAVDAVFGTGFHGVAAGDPADAVEALNRAAVPVVSADIPSGVAGDTGAVEGPAVRASITVAFGALKCGNVLFPGAALCGDVEVAAIGFPEDLLDSGVGLVERADVASLWPSRPPETHKRAAGTVLVVGGSRNMTGAVCLVAAAAYRAGAGLVTVATVPSALAVVKTVVTEATYIELPETDEGTIGADALKVLWDRLGGFDAFAIGPGLGRNDETDEFVRGLVQGVPRTAIVDADALTAFADRADRLTDRGAGELVLTPHAGEFARLSGSTVEEIERRRIESVRELVRRVQATVLLKGSRTVIGAYGMAESALNPIPMRAADGSATYHADPRPDPVRINPTGGAYLATAGSGDVLTGVIAALLARGLTPLDAATAGAYVHGVAGAIAAEGLGAGTTAGDVCDRIPRAVLEVTA